VTVRTLQHNRGQRLDGPRLERQLRDSLLLFGLYALAPDGSSVSECQGTSDQIVRPRTAVSLAGALAGRLAAKDQGKAVYRWGSPNRAALTGTIAGEKDEMS
jgi:hypothetical protein